MLKTDRVIVVEGKYDAIRLANIIDAVIFRTDGFGIFNDHDKQALLRRLAEQHGLIVLTDSDSAGFLIRNFIKSSIPSEQILQVFVPDIYGKEKRKDHPSAEGKLGVEGIPDDVLIEAFRKVGITDEPKDGTEMDRPQITSMDFYRDGYSGCPDSKTRRLRLQELMGLPERMTGKQLLQVINLLSDMDEYKRLTRQILEEEDNDNNTSNTGI